MQSPDFRKNAEKNGCINDGGVDITKANLKQGAVTRVSSNGIKVVFFMLGKKFLRDAWAVVVPEAIQAQARKSLIEVDRWEEDFCAAARELPKPLVGPRALGSHTLKNGRKISFSF